MDSREFETSLRSLRKRQLCLLLLGLLLAFAAPGVRGQEALDVIGRVNRDLPDLAGPIYEGGSDRSSAVFQAEFLPDLTRVVQSTIGEKMFVSDASAMAVDPASLRLGQASDLRVYFVSEGAGYRNALGYSTGDLGVADPTARTIFNDASSSVSTYDPGIGATRSSNAPLLPGDFVDLGRFDGGTVLDFFILANGATSGLSNVYYPSADRNADGMQHAVTLAVENSPYLVIGFEDLWGGGDRDYNDLVIALDVGKANVAKIVGAPEPPLPVIATLLVLLVLWKGKEERRHA